MTQYAHDHDNHYPETFGHLLKEGYLMTARAFVCPSSGRDVPEEFRDADLKALDLSVLDRVDEWSDYVRVRGFDRSVPGGLILLHERYGSHGGGGTNCFFSDGRSRWLPREEFERLLREQTVKIRQVHGKTVE